MASRSSKCNDLWYNTKDFLGFLSIFSWTSSTLDGLHIQQVIDWSGGFPGSAGFLTLARAIFLSFCMQKDVVVFIFFGLKRCAWVGIASEFGSYCEVVSHEQR
ncbi:hypothetical protein B0T20DRAFT_55532 [Sordaria brevicollis]|uniref:Uncharacterized protein n=1 Tax=Sordaria brevicollis TaxID=83679 RepID=A0AAE0U6H6_SORBR|nr:hypothetical protein B0T20DRAFT_55532 [Sordaria brevicollis]